MRTKSAFSVVKVKHRHYFIAFSKQKSKSCACNNEKSLRDLGRKSWPLIFYKRPEVFLCVTLTVTLKFSKLSSFLILLALYLFFKLSSFLNFLAFKLFNLPQKTSKKKIFFFNSSRWKHKQTFRHF